MIALLLGQELDNGSSLKDAIKNLVETKLLGTWKLAFMPLNNPQNLFFTKNAGEMILGTNDDYAVVTTGEGLVT